MNTKYRFKATKPEVHRDISSEQSSISSLQNKEPLDFSAVGRQVLTISYSGCFANIMRQHQEQLLCKQFRVFIPVTAGRIRMFYWHPK